MTMPKTASVFGREKVVRNALISCPYMHLYLMGQKMDRPPHERNTSEICFYVFLHICVCPPVRLLILANHRTV